MALIDKASLLMVPSVYEDGTLYNVLPSGNKAPDETGNHNGYDQTRADFTFSRGFNLAATRVNANGLIEKGRENILLRSNDFDNWNSNTGVSFTTGQEGYDGTNDAWKLDLTAAGGRVQNSNNASGVHTLSVYAKAGSLNWVRIITNSVSTQDMYFDLANGVKGTSTYGGQIDATITSVGNGWYRCTLTDDKTLYNVRIYPAQGDRDLTATSGNIYIQDAQLEAGLVATDYIETGATTATAGVLENTPRIDYSSGAGALLLEPQRTNSTAQSEYIGASGVGALNVTNNTSETTSPEGLYNATLIAEDTTTGYHRIGISHGSMSNATKTFSVFAKWAGGSGRKWLTMDNGPICYFDLENGTKGNVGANCTADIEDYGNGWYRCYFTHTSSSSGTLYVGTANVNGGPGNHLGNGEDAMYLYGVQAEDGASYPSSYVPTYGSAATRGADACSVTGASDVIGQTEGTLFVEFEYSNNSVGVVSIHSGNIGNRIYIGTDLNGLISQVRVGYVQQAFFNTPLTIGTTYKCAIAYKANDFALYVNGSQIGTDTSGSVPSSMIKFGFESGAGGDVLNQPTKQTILFNERLSNTELAALTA